MTDVYHDPEVVVKPPKYDPKRSARRLNAPQKLRQGEVRGGGFIVIQRTSKKKLLRPSAWPVEVGSLAEAYVAARRLQCRFPDREFCIFEQVGSLDPKAAE